MPGPSDDITRVSSQKMLEVLKRSMENAAKRAESDETSPTDSSLGPRSPDVVDIRGVAVGQATSEPSDDEVKASVDMDKYLAMLHEMPDVRDEEVERVESILAEEGYSSEAISQMLDDLLEDL